jgi:toxin ParE1/3/4
MPKVRYVKRAYADLDDITAFSLEKFGIEQTENYLDDLHEQCLLLAEYPRMGKLADSPRTKWRRFEHQSHIILYSINRAGISVQRIIHRDRLLSRAIR